MLNIEYSSMYCTKITRSESRERFQRFDDVFRVDKILLMRGCDSWPSIAWNEANARLLSPSMPMLLFLAHLSMVLSPTLHQSISLDKDAAVHELFQQLLRISHV